MRALRVFYYYPADRPPHDGYQARLEKLLRHAQEFYARGMSDYGLPASKLRLGAKDGRLLIRLVPGRLTLAEHERGKSETSIEQDVALAMQRAGLDGTRETVLVFSNLLVWEGARNRELGPYHGRWDAARGSGVCYAFDDPLLDPDRLSSRQPGGWYVDHPCSIGEFNSHYIGGILHELGHGLGLPHESESATERTSRGISLMGRGNHPYGQERRGEGRGTFLTETSAYGLAQHPLFRPDPAPVAEPEISWKEFEARKEGSHLILRGRVSSGPAPFCISAFADPAGDGDYDATTDTARIDKDGRFELKVPDLWSATYEARILLTARGGGRRSFSAPLIVQANGSADLSLLVSQADWQAVHRAWTEGKKARAVALARQVVQSKPSAENRRCLAILERSVQSSQPVPPEKTPATVKELPLSRMAWVSAEVGWGASQRDQVLPFEDRSPFLRAGGHLYERGLYAHAPSKYVFRPGERWGKLDTAFGIQDGLGGSVVFVIRADGKELYRSLALHSGQTGKASVSLRGVTTLELVTEDAGDGNHSDWGLWLDPVMRR